MCNREESVWEEKECNQAKPNRGRREGRGRIDARGQMIEAT